MSILTTYLKLNKIYESKEDIERFINKFGQDAYDLFRKSTQRLKNNKVSTDLSWHVKNSNPEELNTILYNLQNRIITKAGSLTEMDGKSKFLGEEKGYKVYEILDYLAAINLGSETGWCVAGRYNHYGEENYAPNIDEAKGHWANYTNKHDARIFYFIPIAGGEKFAAVVYPDTVENNDGSYSNYEVFDAKDHNYTKEWKLPLELIPLELETYRYAETELDVDLSLQNKIFSCPEFITAYTKKTSDPDSLFKNVKIEDLILEWVVVKEKVHSHSGEYLSSVGFNIMVKTLKPEVIEYAIQKMEEFRQRSFDEITKNAYRKDGIRLCIEIEKDWHEVMEK